MLQEKFYNFRKSCIKGVLVNEKYKITEQELKDIIDNKVIDLKELDNKTWQIDIEGNNTLIVERV